MVALIVFNGGIIQEEELATSFYVLNKLECLSNSSHAEKDFDSISRLASKSFANRNIINKKVVISLFNPSISDYVINEYRNNFSKLENIFYSLNTLESLRQLEPLRRSNIIHGENINKLKKGVFDNAVRQNKSYDYIILSAYFLIDNEGEVENILPVIGEITNNNKPVKNIEYLFYMINSNIDCFSIKKYDFILNSIKEYGLNEEGLKGCADFIFRHDHNNDELLLEFEKQVNLFLIDSLEKNKNDIDLSNMVCCCGNEYSNYYDIDDDDIRQELNDMAVKIVNDIFPCLVNKLIMDIEEFVYEIDIDIDIDGLKESYFDSLKDEDDTLHLHPLSSANEYQDIDDLFERT